MKRSGRKKEWSILGFCAFLLGIFPPILFLFDRPVLFLNLPLSFLYLYGIWAFVIVFVAIGARRRKPPVLQVGSQTGEANQSNEAVQSVTDYV